jgi:dihydroflavonol-4-reductase
MTVAVTGATGHLGANLVRQLVADGRHVRALTYEPSDQPVAALDGLDVERVQADIRDADAMLHVLDGVETVFHLAARISVVPWDADDVWETNVLGTQNVVDACLARGVRRLVHVSSFHAIKPEAKKATLEDRPSSTDALASYPRSKAYAEQVVRFGVDRGLEAIIVNPTAMIGPWDTVPSMFGRLMLDLWRGRMPALIDGGVNLVDVRDVASAMRAAEHVGRIGERYILAGHWLSVRELAEIACPLAGRRVPRVVIPMGMARKFAPVATRVARTFRRLPRFTDQALLALEDHRVVLGGRAMDELGHDPRRIEETIGDTYVWFRRDAAARQLTSLTS